MNDGAFEEEIPAHLMGLVAQLDGLKAGPGEACPPDLEARDFRIGELIGRGGMGSVYCAEQLSLGRKVAVKVLSADLVRSERERVQFLNEARTIAMLHHPGIIKVLSAGEADGHCYYAMELVDGTGLDRWTFDSREEAVGIAVQAAEALAYAHRCGVLHRDIKPANVFLDRKGVARIGDFGIAFALEANGVVIEEAGRQSGTPAYMAPERLQRGENSVRTDIYSFGVMLRDILKDSDLQPDRELSAIISHAAAYDANDRYADMEALGADLRHYLAHEPVEAAHPSAVRRLTLWMRRNRLATAGLVAAFCLLLLFVTALVVGYVRTRAALVQVEAEAERTRAALAQTEREAAQAASTLASAMTDVDRSSRDLRDAELRRALAAANGLLARFPENDEIKAATNRLNAAIERHREMPLRPRFRSGPRPR